MAQQQVLSLTLKKLPGELEVKFGPRRLLLYAFASNQFKPYVREFYALNGFNVLCERACEKFGVKLSGLSAHTPLTKPEINVEYLKQAVRFAAECGAPVVNTDEGPKQPWTTEAEDSVLMKYTIHEAAHVAEPRGILLGLECHQQYSRSPEGLDRIHALVNSPAVGINFDTGNAYLCGQDPIAWLQRVADRLVHLHAKDISVQQGSAERGKVTGTPVGYACGDGVVDWKRVIEICRRAKRDIVLSVECGTIEQAERSIAHLTRLL